MSTYGSQICIPGLKAGADLSAKQYHFVELSADFTVTACNGTTDKALGVLQNDPDASGEEATVAAMGTTKIVAGAAIAVGALIAPTAAGKAQTAVATQYPRAIALEAAAADGDVISVFLLPLPLMA
jgi:hypothetical protein